VVFVHFLLLFYKGKRFIWVTIEGKPELEFYTLWELPDDLSEEEKADLEDYYDDFEA